MRTLTRTLTAGALATLVAALGLRDQRDRRDSDASLATNASRSIGFRK